MLGLDLVSSWLVVMRPYLYPFSLLLSLLVLYTPFNPVCKMLCVIPAACDVTVGDRAIPVATTCVWNELARHLTSASFLRAFLFRYWTL